MFKYTMSNGGPLMYCSFNEFITVINSLSNDIKIDLNYYILKNNFLETTFCFMTPYTISMPNQYFYAILRIKIYLC